MSTATESNAWRILNQSQTEHLGDYCTLSHAIAYVGGILQVNQRSLDTPEGYAEGQARARLIAAAPAMLEALETLMKCSAFKETGICGQCQGVAQAAIKLAKGESQ